MGYIEINKEFSIIDPIQYNNINKSKTNYFSLNSSIVVNYNHKEKNDTLANISRKAIYNTIFLRNFNAPNKKLSDFKNNATIYTISNNKLIKYIENNTNDNVKRIDFKTYASNLDEMYQALWFLQENYSYSFGSEEFIKDDKHYFIINVEKNDDKIKINYQENCEENVINDLKDNYQYDKSTKTLIIDTDTYKYKDKDCNYSTDQIQSTHIYNKVRKFTFNQDVSGSDDTVVAGTLIDVKTIYPPQLNWSDLKDRSFDVKDTDGNTHSLTVKDSDNDNNQISFKEDIDYDIDNGTKSNSNDDDNQDDKDDKTINTDKNKDNIKIDFNDNLLIYSEYILDTNNKKCYLTDDKSLLIESNIETYGILLFKSNNKVSDKYTLYNNNILLFNGMYSLHFAKKNYLQTLLGGHLINPYDNIPVLNKYLFYLVDYFNRSNSDSTYFKLGKDDTNKIEWSFNISTDTYLSNKNVGYYFELLDNNNFKVTNIKEDYTIEYIISDLIVNYTLDNKTFKIKAKDNTKYIVFPLVHNLIYKLSLNDFTNLLNYAIKYIIRLEKNSSWILNYNFNAELFNNMLNKYTKDKDEFKYE